MDDFLDDEFVKKLQEEIIEDARKLYAEEVIDRWLNPRNFGTMENAQGYGKQTGACGDVMEIWLRVLNDTIHEAHFMTEGCGPTLACGSMITRNGYRQNGFKTHSKLMAGLLRTAWADFLRNTNIVHNSLPVHYTMP